jgi:hypothetical protein
MGREGVEAVGDRPSRSGSGGASLGQPNAQRGAIATGSDAQPWTERESLALTNGHPDPIDTAIADAVSPYHLLAVTWRDAWFDFDGNSERDDYLVRTVGFLVKDGPRFLSLAQEMLPDGDGFRAVTHIPVAVVEKREPL